MNKKSPLLLLVILVALKIDAQIVENSDYSFNISLPVLLTGNITLDNAFRIAIGDLFTNIQDYKSKMNGATRQRLNRKL